jgi:hypothetical protein
VLHRLRRPVRILVELAAVTLLWHILGSHSWLTDVGFAVWIIVVAEGVQFWDRRRKSQSAEP